MKIPPRSSSIVPTAALAAAVASTGGLPAELVSVSERIDLPAVMPVVAQHRRLAVDCPTCGVQVVAPVPEAARGIRTVHCAGSAVALRTQRGYDPNGRGLSPGEDAEAGLPTAIHGAGSSEEVGDMVRSKFSGSKDRIRSGFFIALLAILPISSFAFAQGNQRQSVYAPAVSAFRSLDPRQRYEIQALLAAAGYWNAVSSDDYSVKLFNALVRFESENGLPLTGIVDAAQATRLRELASPLLRNWQLRPVRNPFYAATLWVPAGLGLALKQTEQGLQFEDRGKTLRIYFHFLSGAALDRTFQDLISTREQNDFAIDYKVIRPEFFVINGRKPEALTYVRYQVVPGGLVGFSAFADTGSPELNFERLIVLMSDLFRAEVQLGEARRPPEPIGGTTLVDWERPSPSFGQGAVGSQATTRRTPSPQPVAPNAAASRPGVIVTIPPMFPAAPSSPVAASPAPRPDATETGRTAAATPPALAPPQEPPPVPPPPAVQPWQPDARVVELLIQLRYLRAEEDSPTRSRFDQVVREFGADRRLGDQLRGDGLVERLRSAAQSEGRLEACGATPDAAGAVCIR